MTRERIGVLLSALCICFSVARAQQFRGSIFGQVLDESGARVSGAKIVIRAVGLATERHATSDSHGEFRLDDLEPGPYQAMVTAAGFADASANVDVIVAMVRGITVAMKPRSVQQTVSVQGQASSITAAPLDLSSAVHESAVSEKDLQTIPLAARSFANIAYLAPGTEPVEPSDPTKARITAVSTGGSSGLNNVLSVDGGDNSDDYIGGFLQNISPDAIQEFTVRTAQMDADTGGTTAGSVVITTKRGTNDWHGSAAFYDRDSALNARFPIDNPAPNPKQPFSRQNYVGTLGGPVARNKVWFFSSFEFVHEDASVAYSNASLTQFNALAQLAAMGLVENTTTGVKVNSIPVPSSVPVPFRDYLGTTRLDWAQSARSMWFLRGAVDSYVTHNDLVEQGSLPSTGAISHSNYFNMLVSNQYTFSPSWLGAFTFDASYLHHTEARSSDLGFALAFPFTTTSQTTSGLETFGDNQFVTAITAFPVLRNQEKYQWRYDVTNTMGRHAPHFGVNFIHEPVLSGALTATPENFTQFVNDPTFYVGNPNQFTSDLTCDFNPAPGSPLPPATLGTMCTSSGGGSGSFSQNVQRLGMYAQDSWRVAERFTVNYGLRYDTTFGLFTASGRSQLDNPAFLTLKALGIPLVSGAPHDYRAAFAPRLGLAYALGESENTVIRAGIGLFYDDLAQNGWVNAFQGVNTAPGICVTPGVSPGDAGCIQPGATGSIIDRRYKTPYALHVTGGVQHAFNSKWMASADFTHEEGNHAYRHYTFTPSTLIAVDPMDQKFVPNINLYKSDNRSSFNGLFLHLQGNVSRRFNVIANYTLSKAQTWGCVLGELFDYVNGVCDPLHAFAKGDYGPSGEDVRHRFVLAGTLHVPGGFDITTLTQAESARPITLTTPVDVNGFGDTLDDRAIVNGVQTTLDQIRGTPYIQADLRVARPINFREQWSVTPFIEFFNLFNRNNPGANYVTNIGALPVNSLFNVTALCPTPACAVPVTSPNQLRVPAGALGDFFGPGTTVGIPFAAQIGARLTF
ncbi:MAG: carboxypeptidase regulatory-like domain-containing protein [Candidatus Acidiferrales bacterium]